MSALEIAAAGGASALWFPSLKNQSRSSPWFEVSFANSVSLIRVVGAMQKVSPSYAANELPQFAAYGGVGDCTSGLILKDSHISVKIDSRVRQHSDTLCWLASTARISIRRNVVYAITLEDPYIWKEWYGIDSVSIVIRDRMQCI